MDNPAKIERKLQYNFTRNDFRLMRARIRLYRALWSCTGFLTGRKNLNDVYDEVIHRQRRELDQKFWNGS